MKQIVREFWLSRGTLVFLTFLAMALVGMAWVMMAYQRHGYEVSLDASLARSIEQIRKDIQDLKHQDIASIRDREAIRQDVEQVRKVIEPEPRESSKPE